MQAQGFAEWNPCFSTMIGYCKELLDECALLPVNSMLQFIAEPALFPACFSTFSQMAQKLSRRWTGLFQVYCQTIYVI